MIDINLSIPQSFLNEEVRGGYVVSSKMKEVWAIELDLLNEAMKVMDSYGIKYYVIGGTLLGAVRHKGYIPWDDDIDVVMPRSDYDRFAKIAPKIFKHPYLYQDEYTEPGILYGHAKLRNSNTTCFLADYVYNPEKHGSLNYNQGIFIDFFAMDNIPDDISAQKKWYEKIKKKAAKAWELRNFTHHRGAVKPERINTLKWKNRLLKFIGQPDLLFRRYDYELGRFAKCITQKSTIYCVAYKDKKNRFVWDSVDFDNLVSLPFEFLTVKAPANYEHVLTQSFGDWKTPVQANSEHGAVNSIFFDTNLPFTEFTTPEGCIDIKKVKAHWNFE